MKRLYITPALTVVDMGTDVAILAVSGGQKGFEVGMSKDAMDGSQSLSNQKHSIWGSEEVWK